MSSLYPVALIAGDRAGTLMHFLDRGQLTPDLVSPLFKAIDGIGSDSDRAGIPIRTARRGLVRTPGLRRAYLAAAEEIGSDGDRESALRAINNRQAEQ